MDDHKHMKALKQRYLELVNERGEEASRLKAFQHELRAQSKRNRLAIIGLYEAAIEGFETKGSNESPAGPRQQ